MKTLILSGITGFMGFILGIAYTVQAHESSALVSTIAVLKGVFELWSR